MIQYWILNPDHSVRPAKDNEDFYAWLDEVAALDVTRVAETWVDGDCWVSTVFLQIDHNFAPDRPPILFETMIFGGEHNLEGTRYSTWDEAKQGHKWIVDNLMGGKPPQAQP